MKSSYDTDEPTRLINAGRRERNRANGDCINENRHGSHGKATHGCRCRPCYARHAGIPLHLVPEVYTPGRTGRPISKPRRLNVSTSVYRYLDAMARARGTTIRAVADELIGGGITDEEARN